MPALPIDATTYRSPNYNARPLDARIEAIVLHSTEGMWPTDIRWLCASGSAVSAHYVIAPDGQVYQTVNDGKRAWHAGESFYASRRDYNSFSLGVELSHRAGSPYGAAQVAALTALCRDLIARYDIARGLVVTHYQVAAPPGRKTDPSDFPPAEFGAWADALYTSGPLRTHTIAGYDGRERFCGSGFADFYALRGGFALFGYAREDETRATDSDGEACTFMPLERAVLKYVAGVGVHLALLGEARAMGWLP